MHWAWQDGTQILLHASMGVGLAACAGLRAFLPLLIAGLAVRLGWLELSDGWSWLGDWPALTVFAVAVVLELAADKLPVVDHLLDGAATFVKPVAGAALMASAVAEWTPLYATVLWILIGGSLAALVHGAKSQVRLASTGLTGGLANPVVSAVEDGAALAGSLAAVFVPVVVAALAVLALVAVWLLLLRRRRRRPA